jgi:hypothetical protein
LEDIWKAQEKMDYMGYRKHMRRKLDNAADV